MQVYTGGLVNMISTMTSSQYAQLTEKGVTVSVSARLLSFETNKNEAIFDQSFNAYNSVASTLGVQSELRGGLPACGAHAWARKSVWG